MATNGSTRDTQMASADEPFARLEVRSLLRSVVVAVVGFCTLATDSGCQLPSHKTQKLEAEQDWNRVRAEFKLGLANQQLEHGRVSEAVATLQEAVALDLRSPTYHRILARCYLEQGALTAARDATELAKQLGDTSAELAYTQGMIAERGSRDEEALRYYLEAAELEPTNMDYLLAAAEYLVTVGRADEAKAFLDEQLRRLQGDGQLLLLRARICVLLGDPEQAAADFEAAEDLLADAPWAAEEFGLVLVRLGRYAEALAVLRPLVEAEGRLSEEEPGALPASAAVVRALATCQNRVGKPAKAKLLLEEHLRQSPDDGRAWWLLAESLMRLGDWDGVQHCIQQGEQTAPGTPHWRLLRACLAFHGGDMAAATTLLESVLSERPDNVLAHCLLGQVHEQRDELERARDHYETALRIDPDVPWARARLRDMPSGK